MGLKLSMHCAVIIGALSSLSCEKYDSINYLSKKGLTPKESLLSLLDDSVGPIIRKNNNYSAMKNILQDQYNQTTGQWMAIYLFDFDLAIDRFVFVADDDNFSSHWDFNAESDQGDLIEKTSKCRRPTKLAAEIYVKNARKTSRGAIANWREYVIFKGHKNEIDLIFLDPDSDLHNELSPFVYNCLEIR